MSRVKKLLLVVVSAVLVSLLWAPSAHADVNDFTVTSFEADYTLTNADKQGTMRIKERLDVEFTDNNHGILRALPNSYKDEKLHLKINQVTSPSGAPAQYATYQDSGNTVLKIGDPNRTVTGLQSYIIDYTVTNVISFYDGHDELFWDINGDQWGQTFKKVWVTLHLPNDLKLDDHNPLCYTGVSGSTEQACKIGLQQPIRYDPKGYDLSAAATRDLRAAETMTIVVGFDKGYFRPVTAEERAVEYAWMAAKFLVPFLLVAGVAGRHWYKYGRDPKGRGVIVPEYEAPDGLKPIEAGTVVDFSTDNRDITATVIDLAIRGYIKIIETKNVRRFRKDITTYSLRLLKTDHKGLADFEQSLLKAVFVVQAVNEEIDLSVLKYKLAAEAIQLRKSVKGNLVTRGYFFRRRLVDNVKFGLLLLGCFIVAFVFTVLAASWAIAGLIAGSALAVIFLILMPARTPKGVAAKDSILGLKMYLEVAEAERIKKLQAPNAAYAPKGDEPRRTVELFEKLLPYAMVLGVEQQWAKQFEDIYRTPPDWYQGSSAAHFSAAYLATTLNSGVGASVNTAFSAPSSSGSSGFSGGGSSGGGGGGGGGGGW